LGYRVYTYNTGILDRGSISASGNERVYNGSSVFVRNACPGVGSFQFFGGGSLQCGQSSLSTLPLCPVGATTVSGSSIVVQSSQDVYLAPGTYNSITVRDRGTLRVSSGEYFVNTFSSGYDSVLNAVDGSVGIIASGTISINDRTDFIGSWRLVSDSTSSTAISLGYDINNSQDDWANLAIYAPQGGFRLRRGRISGILNAKTITLGDDSRFSCSGFDAPTSTPTATPTTTATTLAT